MNGKKKKKGVGLVPINFSSFRKERNMIWSEWKNVVIDIACVWYHGWCPTECTSKHTHSFRNMTNPIVVLDQ
jgi:hypothetical protein